MTSRGEPRIYICVRHTLDWHDEAAVMAGLRPSFRPKLETWNATLDPPYHVFRTELKRIALGSFAAVAHATQAPPGKLPRGALVIPVDDDDWLAPDLARRLAGAYDPATAGYLWDRLVIEPPRHRTLRLPFRRWWSRWRPFTCATNNYAIAFEPALTAVIESHGKASRYFDADRSRITRVPGTLAIQNRNVSSQTAMEFRRPSIGRDKLVRSVERYRTLYASFELPPELRWAAPYLERMDELMRRLRVK